MVTVAYLRDTAQQAGIDTSALLMREIGWNAREQQPRDLNERLIRSMFMLYP